MSDTRNTLERLLGYLPSVKGPTGHVPFNNKLLWTAAVLILYFTLTNIPVWGLSTTGSGSDLFGQFRSILAGSQGSILQLGIGPIVTASIVLQMLTGTDILNFDLSDPRDQSLYQSLQKALVFVMVVITGLAIAFSGTFLPPSGQLATLFDISITMVQFIMFLQIAFGGMLIFYLDSIITKYGIGSGVGLFIIAGVSQQLIGGIVSQIIPTWIGFITGSIPINPVTSQGISTLIFGSGAILGIITTITIFFAVVYTESTRVEIPISNSRFSGARGKFPVKLIYASVMPLILVRAVQANIQFVGRFLDSQLGAAMPSWIGTYVDGIPIDGLFYFISPIQSPDQWMWWSGAVSVEVWKVLLRVGIDVTWMVIGGAIFALFWVETTGMGSESSAEKLKRSGLQIPGFRSNKNILTKVMDRYVPFVTVIGGALVGLFAVLANLLGTIGGVTGTGLLLAVSITYKIYEEIAQEQLMEMDSRLRKFFEG